MQKKSLINTLKTTKKANVITAPAKNEGAATRKALPSRRPAIVKLEKFQGY